MYSLKSESKSKKKKKLRAGQRIISFGEEASDIRHRDSGQRLLRLRLRLLRLEQTGQSLHASH